MSLLDFITGGDKPVMRQASPAESRVLGLSTRLLDSPERAGLSRLSGLYDRSVAKDNTRRRSNLLGTAAAYVQQAVGGQPVTLNDAVDRALTRARGMSRVLRSTSDDYDVLSDRARLSVARAGRGRQGIGIATLSDVASLGDQVGSAQFARARQSDELRANRLGGVVGFGLGAIPDIKRAINTSRTRRSQESLPGGDAQLVLPGRNA